VGSIICCPYKLRQLLVGAEYYSAHNAGFEEFSDSIIMRIKIEGKHEPK
jgi:hypothetical protein